jgi:hypothetical protein
MFNETFIKINMMNHINKMLLSEELEKQERKNLNLWLTGRLADVVKAANSAKK